MAITRLLSKSTFGPEEIREITCAFEDALSSLHLSDSQSAEAERLALKIMECARSGEIERNHLRNCALAGFKV